MFQFCLSDVLVSFCHRAVVVVVVAVTVTVVAVTVAVVEFIFDVVVAFAISHLARSRSSSSCFISFFFPSPYTINFGEIHNHQQIPAKWGYLSLSLFIWIFDTKTR
jgi:hypothetical protein